MNYRVFFSSLFLTVLFSFSLSLPLLSAELPDKNPGSVLISGYEKVVKVCRGNLEKMSDKELLDFGKSFFTPSDPQKVKRLLELMISREVSRDLKRLNTFIKSADDDGLRSLYSSFEFQYLSLKSQSISRETSCVEADSLGDILLKNDYKNSILAALLFTDRQSLITCEMFCSFMYLVHNSQWVNEEISCSCHSGSNSMNNVNDRNLISGDCGDDSRVNFLTWKEIKHRLARFSSEYSDIFEMTTLGKTVEGRLIPLLKISDNVQEDEDEPEILYVSGLHPREQQPYVCLLEFIEDILSGYNKDSKITDLVNNREIWFVPMLNVDGKIHDFKKGTSPRQRAMWRKNRLLNVDRTRGVDLNRNFPVRWLRTTLNGTVQDFPGTHPASEPETRALMNFVKSRPLRAFIDIHSYMGTHIFPKFLTEKDALIYKKLLKELADTQLRPYPFKDPVIDGEPPFETHHGGAGLSFVWAFYATGAYSMNVEVGGRGFYPYLNSILKEYKDNIRGPFFHLLDVCSTFPLATKGEAKLIDGIFDGLFKPQALLTWRPVVKGDCKYGVLVSMSANVRVLAEYRLAPFEKGFTLKVMPKAKVGDVIPMVLYLWDDEHRFTVEKFEFVVGENIGSGRQQ